MVRGGSNNGGRGSQGSFIQNGEVTAIEDSTSPYFLHNGDHPGLILVTNLLSGSNFHTWRRAMLMALTAKNKLEFVDGTIPRPLSTDLLFHAWSRCNNMISSWIINSVNRDIADSLLYHDSAYEIWNDLCDRFNQGNGPLVFQIKRQLCGLVQGSLDVSSYFTKLKVLWDELKEFQPVPVCQCGGLWVWLDHQHKEYVLHFLMGLNESYAQIRGQILMMEPLPAINKVFSLVIQEERHINIGVNYAILVSEPLAFGSNSNVPSVSSGGSKTKRDKVTCTHCGFIGHTKDKCYTLVGYPPSWRVKSNTSNSMANNSEVINQVNVNSTEQAVSSLTNDQCQQLIQLLSTQLASASSIVTNPPSTCPFISNFTATHHVCNDLSSFTSYVTVQNIKFKLPNGISVPIERIGSIILAKAVKLFNELSQGKMIGKGKWKGKLYHLQFDSFLADTHCIVTSCK
ncbi:hypothetical protein UlMin_010537 [Ulmus minor]